MNNRIASRSILCSALFVIAAAGCGGTNADGSTAQPISAATSSPQAAATTTRNVQDCRFEQHFDRNGNGTVELTELPARMQAHVAAADTNHDGVIASAEMTAFRETHGIQSHFAAADNNHDGTLAAAELTAFAETRRAAQFARIDTNSDGAITADEAGKRWVHVSVADTNQDGRVSRAELDQAHASGAMRGAHRGMHRDSADAADKFEHGETQKR